MGQSILLHWEKLTLKCPIPNGKILEVWNRLRNNFKRWSCSQLNILRNLWNLAWVHPKEFSSTAHQDAERLSSLRQLPTNVVPTSFQSKVHKCWLCGSVKVKPMSEMSSIRQELPHLASSSLTSWTLLQLLEEEETVEVTEEEQETESSISCWPRWTVLVLKRIFSLLVPLTDPRSWIKLYFDQ